MALGTMIGLLVGGILYGARWPLSERVLRWPPRRFQRVRRTLRMVVPMRDGILLATDHYEPTQPGKYPTILIRNPYGSAPSAGAFGRFMAFFAASFARRGYHVVVQDTRGRFDSGGTFTPYFNEHDDGLDTLQWVVAQPWYDAGQGIALWGPSYLGITQWAIAAHSKHIRAIMPTMTSSNLRQIIYPDDAVDLQLAVFWATIFHGIDQHKGQPLLYSTPLLWQIPLRTHRALKHLPITDTDRVATGGSVDFFQFWLDHNQPDDPLWEEIQHAVQVNNVQAAPHLISGWYDFFLRGLLNDYATLKTAGHNPYLTIGPWHHLQPDNPMAMVDAFREGVWWFDAHLKGKKSALRQQPVRIFVMGANEWRDMPAFPPPARTMPLYLAAENTLSVNKASANCPVDQYTYNPAEPTPALGGTKFDFLAGPRDNRSLERRPDVLVFTSQVLQKPLEIIDALCQVERGIYRFLRVFM
jgi:uncharacterized protein